MQHTTAKRSIGAALAALLACTAFLCACSSPTGGGYDFYYHDGHIYRLCGAYIPKPRPAGLLPRLLSATLRQAPA